MANLKFELRVLLLVSFISCLLALHRPWIRSKSRGELKNIGGDPADSWLAYTISQGNGNLVTFVNATWKVPSYPSSRNGQSNAPGWLNI